MKHDEIEYLRQQVAFGGQRGASAASVLAKAGVSAIFKEQERDDHGRFASGSGESVQSQARSGGQHDAATHDAIATYHYSQAMHHEMVADDLHNQGLDKEGDAHDKAAELHETAGDAHEQLADRAKGSIGDESAATGASLRSIAAMDASRAAD